MRYEATTIKPIAALLGVLASLVLLACGSGSSADRSSSRLTKPELITKADPICARFNAKRATITLGSVRYARSLQPLASYEWSQIAQLDRLIPPDAMEANWLHMLDDARTVAEVTATLSAYAQTGSLRSGRAMIPAAVKAERQFAELAKHYGFNECSDTI